MQPLSSARRTLSSLKLLQGVFIGVSNNNSSQGRGRQPKGGAFLTLITNQKDVKTRDLFFDIVSQVYSPGMASLSPTELDAMAFKRCSAIAKIARNRDIVRFTNP